MRPERYHADDLRHLLQQRKIATMDELKEALGSAADVTVFRKLAGLGYHTSYSHRGRYYTLDELAHFDALGLWSFRQVFFSRFGTLVATLEELVGAAEAGYDVTEAEAVVQVGTKDALVLLVREGRLTRQKVGSRYLYLAPDASLRRSQLAARSVYDSEPSGFHLGAGLRLLPDELKAAIVLFYSLLDERQRRLYAGLEAMKIGHGGDTQIAGLLDMDPGTVARGRRELLGGDVETDRVRRSGGGRHSAQKNSRGHRRNHPADGQRHRWRPDERDQVDPAHHREDRRAATRLWYRGVRQYRRQAAQRFGLPAAGKPQEAQPGLPG